MGELEPDRGASVTTGAEMPRTVCLRSLDCLLHEEERGSDLCSTAKYLCALMNITFCLARALLLVYPPAAYCVYEVYSWDVMEPASYFLMVRTLRLTPSCTPQLTSG